MILLSLFLLASVWEFWLEEQIQVLFLDFQEAESFDKKIEYVITIMVFGILAMIAPLYLSIQSEKKKLQDLQERENLIAELQATLSEVQHLQGIIPICSYCNKIRNEEGAWDKMEVYIQNHSDAAFSHGICPQCKARESEKIHKSRT